MLQSCLNRHAASNPEYKNPACAGFLYSGLNFWQYQRLQAQYAAEDKKAIE